MIILIIYLYFLKNKETFQNDNDNFESKEEWKNNLATLKIFIDTNNSVPFTDGDTEIEKKIAQWYIIQANRYFDYLDFDFNKNSLKFFVQYPELRNEWEIFLFLDDYKDVFYFDFSDYNFMKIEYMKNWVYYTDEIIQFINENNRLPKKDGEYEKEKELGLIITNIIANYVNFTFNFITENNFMKNIYVRKTFNKFLENDLYRKLIINNKLYDSLTKFNWNTYLDNLKKFLNNNRILPSYQNEPLLYNFYIKQSKNYEDFLDYNFKETEKIIYFINYNELLYLWEEFIFNSLYSNIININFIKYDFFNQGFVNEWNKKLNQVKEFINLNNSIPLKKNEGNSINNTNEDELAGWLIKARELIVNYMFNFLETDNYMKNPMIRNKFLEFIGRDINGEFLEEDGKDYREYIELNFPNKVLWDLNFEEENIDVDNLVGFLDKDISLVNTEMYLNVKNFLTNSLKEKFFDIYKNKVNNKHELYYRNDKLFKYKINDNKNQQNFKFVLNIYNRDSPDNLWVYADLIYDISTTNTFIHNLKLIGIGYQENILFESLKTRGTKIIDNKGIDCSLSDTKECKIGSDILSSTRLDQGVYRCFNKDATTEYECVSPDRNNQVGIWDTECINNEDCTFYKKNKNYNNELGGCVNGYCQFPLNMTNTSYKNHDNKEPLCYNCKPIYKNYNIYDNDDNNYYEEEEGLEDCIGIDCYKCCNDQLDKKLYPNLESPDFSFQNDMFIREQKENRELLESKNLKIGF